MRCIHTKLFFVAVILFAVGVNAPAFTSPAVSPPAHRGRAAPTQTIANLQTAIQGEAHAAYRYALFARRADAEGHHQVAKLFRAAALSERIHRRNHEAVLGQLGVEPRPISYEPVKVASTGENLLVPIRGERQEASEMYPRFIRQARAEDVPAAVRSFRYARDTEAEHDRLFKQALANLGHNRDVDYYVQVESGMVSVRTPSQYPPVTSAGVSGAQAGR